MSTDTNEKLAAAREQWNAGLLPTASPLVIPDLDDLFGAGKPLLDLVNRHLAEAERCDERARAIAGQEEALRARGERLAELVDACGGVLETSWMAAEVLLYTRTLQ